MNGTAITALIAKDLRLFFRNRFFAFVTVLGLVFYVIVYWAMPASVDETLRLGMRVPPPLRALLAEDEEVEGVQLQFVASDEELQQYVVNGDVLGGIAFPDDALERLRAGETPTVTIYLASDAEPEVREMLVVLVEALALTASGVPLDVRVHEEILGPDLAGSQVPSRDRMLPLLAVMVLMVETLGLASLIAEEVHSGAVRALLVTRLRVSTLFAAKTLTGIVLILPQAALLMLLTGGLSRRPLLVLIALFLGALTAIATSFLMASVGRDMLSVMGIGIPAFILLALPTFGVLFPGAFTGWVRLIPSYYLAETVHRVANFGAGWGEVWGHLATLAGINALLYALGIAALKRRLA